MAPPAHDQHTVRFADAGPQNRGRTEHHGPGGMFERAAEDNSLMRLSPSGMNRRGSSTDLDVNGPLSSSRSGSLPAASRFTRVDSGAYRGPFGHQGEDPDQDFAAVTKAHVPREDE